MVEAVLEETSTSSFQDSGLRKDTGNGLRGLPTLTQCKGEPEPYVSRWNVKASGFAVGVGPVGDHESSTVYSPFKFTRLFTPTRVEGTRGRDSQYPPRPVGTGDPRSLTLHSSPRVVSFGPPGRRTGARGGGGPAGTPRPSRGTTPTPVTAGGGRGGGTSGGRDPLPTLTQVRDERGLSLLGRRVLPYPGVSSVSPDPVLFSALGPPG